MNTDATQDSYLIAPNRRVEAGNGTTYERRCHSHGRREGTADDRLRHRDGVRPGRPPRFSNGSFVAQDVILARPALARRVVAPSAPQGGADIHGWAKAHGFLFQHATEFAADVEAFLS
jgi:hypothetical protein